ncbi:MAG: LysR family transcriptional regulator, partial [Pseudomonadota bacterium]
MPMSRLPSLSALRAFEAAARRLSFKEAAGELSVTPGAVSQQIRALETELGIALFNRAPRAVTLTPAGRALMSDVTEGFMRIRDAVDRVRP